MGKKKLVYFLLAAGIITAIPSAGAEAASKRRQKEAEDAYKKFLSSEQIKWSKWNSIPSSLVQFAYSDINKDGIKELILQYTQASHMDGWNRIYTYSKGKVKSLGTFTNITVYKNKNYFTDRYVNGGNIKTSYYRLKKNGKKTCLVKYETSDESSYLKNKKSVKRYSADYGYKVYYHSMKVNGKKTGYKNCFKKIHILEKKAKKTKLKFFENTAVNIKKIIK